MAEETGTEEGSELWQYLTSQLYEKWKQDRKPRENKWNRNRAAMECNPKLDPKGTWSKSEKARDWQSDTFFDITRQKVSTSYALGTDTLFKGGKVAFMLAEPTEGPLERQQTPPEAEERQEDTIKEAEARIHRQLENCDAVTQLSRCFLSGLTYGEYYAKDYITDMTEDEFVDTGGGIFEDASMPQTTKGVEYKPLWNIYRDWETDDLQAGRGVLETDYVSPYDLRQEFDKPHRFNKYIVKVIKDEEAKDRESPDVTEDKDSIPPYLRDLQHSRAKTILKIEGWVRVPLNRAVAFEAKLKQDGVPGFEDAGIVPGPGEVDTEKDDGKEVSVFCIVAGKHIIAYTRFAGRRPYHYGLCEENLDGAGGRGMADNVEYAQKVLNGAIRMYEDNKKQANKIILAIKRRLLEGDFEKEFNSDELACILDLDEEAENASQALHQVVIQDLGDNLLKLIEMFLQFADYSSNMPRAEQGQQSPNPQTAFELQQRLERSGKYLGRIIKNFDLFVQGIIKEFYRYNMVNPELTDGKGNFRVVALGFSSFENRVIRLQKLMALLTLVLSNDLLLREVKIRWLIEEIAKAQDIAAEQLLKTPEEKQTEAEAEEQSIDRQLQLLDGQLSLENRKAQAAKDQAGAQATLAKVEQDDERLKLERAKTVASIEGEARRDLKPGAA